MRHIQCSARLASYELYHSVDANNNNIASDLADYLSQTDPKTNLPRHAYVAQASLAVDVIDTQGVAPSLNIIDPWSMMSNFTLAISGQYNRSQHRNLTYYFPLDLSNPKTFPTCNNPAKASPDDIYYDPLTHYNDLGGDIGLLSVLYTGYVSGRHTQLPDADLEKPQIDNLGFVTQLDFTVVKAVGVGPTWTLTTFKGPSGATLTLGSLG